MDTEKIFQILAQLLRERLQESNISQKALAAQIGCSQSRLNDYLNKTGELGSANFDLILRLFPELKQPILAILEGTGNTHIQQIGGIGNQAAGGNLTIGAETSANYRQQVSDLAIRLSDEQGVLNLAPFLKALQMLKL